MQKPNFCFKRVKNFKQTKNYNLAPMFTINVIVVVNVSNNNQWPSDLFNINVKTISFKVDVTTSTIAHTWALSTLYML